MSAVQHSGEHRVTALVRGFREDLIQVSALPLWSMPAAEVSDALVLLTQARSQLDALQMRVLRHASTIEVGSDAGATTASWWANQTRTTRAEANRTVQLAAALERHDSVASALARGDLRTDQARVVVEAVDVLPADVADWVPVEATRFLLKNAADHDAKALRVLGRRVLEVIDPAAADREEARRLDEEEADARAAASLTMVDDGHGQSHGRFIIPTLHADILRKHLMAIAFPGTFARDVTSPDAAATGPDGDEAPHGTGVHGLHRVATRGLGPLGGRRARDRGGDDGPRDPHGRTQGSASLDTGSRISAGEARRMACRAGHHPGRSRRTVRRA